MNRSRLETMRDRRGKRRRRLLAINLCLLAAVGAVLVWNAAMSGIAGERGAGTPPENRQAENDGTNAATGPDDDGQGGETKEKQETGESEEGAADSGKATGQDGQVRLAFVGDVLLGEYVGKLMSRHGYDYPYQHVRALLQDADVTAANLETAVTAAQEKPGLKTYEFSSAPESLPAFADAGFDLVSLANNHSMDFGPQGLRDTMSNLTANELKYVGAGENVDEANAPVFIEKNGLTVAYLGFSRVIPTEKWKARKDRIGLAETYDYTRPVDEIKKARERADVVVVMVHWGEERKLEAHPKKQTELGRRFVDAGADLVIGSHPHVLQGIEHYKNKWIVYSLGNFIFTKSTDTLTYDSGILYADCGKSGDCGLRLLPVRADTPQPVPMEADKAVKVFDRVSSLSVGASLNEEGYVTKDEAGEQ
ncbi:CapA family protein [Paenibacillus alkalitolerans]|uniref:CapA family protein n=1 Tax=Paenibacillus alkalitolerans TaxID=2799335 RepID=UPI0018F2EBDB|nr:CapA family protein [Paenibacillus alkalitolerans]